MRKSCTDVNPERLGVYPHRDKKLDDPDVKERMDSLGLQHME